MNGLGLQEDVSARRGGDGVAVGEAADDAAAGGFG